MNKTAFEIYSTKKGGIFTSTWNTNLVEVSTTELASTATGTNWAGTSYALGYTHTPGSTVSLASTITSQIGFNFRLVATITDRTVGSVGISWGGTSNTGISTTTTLELLTTATTAQLLITPTSDFDGKIVISLRCVSAPSNQLKLPLVSTGTYNFWVDWGDGTYDNITSWNQAQRIHTYASPGTYKTRISGIITGWESIQGNNYFGDRKKLISITSWGKLKPSSRAFDGCSNMTLSNVNDLLDLSSLTSMQYMFANCTTLTTIGRSTEWNTSTITDLNNCFYNSVNFNSPLNGWNTANVTNLGGTFLGCTNFNQNLGAWNVSNCLFFLGGQITGGTFGNCTNFNNGGSSDINNWVLKSSGNINMGSMFANCTSFNQPLNNWNTTRVTNMNSMFANCTSFNQPLNGWNTANSTSTAAMFYNCTSFNQNIGTFNLTNCTDVNTMLAYCTNFNNGGSPDINNWRFKTTGSVDAYGTLRNMPNFNQPVNNWNTERFSRISTMFYASTSFNQNLNSWNLDNCNIATEVFQSATSFNNGFASGVSTGNQLTWNLPICTLVWNMFASATSFNSNLGNGSTPWIINNCISFGAMFSGATKFNNGDNTAPIANWLFKSSGSISTSSMFNGCIVFNRPLNGLNLSYVTNMDGMFSGCTLFNNGNASGVGNTLTMTLNTTAPFTTINTFNVCTSFNCDVNSLDFTRCTNMYALFNSCTSFNNGNTPGTAGIMTINTSNSASIGYMFFGCSVFNQDIGLFNVSKVISFNGMFFNAYAYNNGADANPINNWTLNTTVGANIDMTNMLGGNQGTKVFNRALNNWNTSEVTNMSSMFVNSGGTAVFNQPIDNWVMSKVTNTSFMFWGSTAFNQSLSNWERVGSTMANVTNMSSMFLSATFNQNINSWNVTKVTNFNSMFESSQFNNGLASGVAGQLTWTTTEALTISRMFTNNVRFNQELINFNVSKVTTFSGMFYGATVFNNGDNTAPINNWNIGGGVTGTITMNQMFQSSKFNRYIGDWDVSKVTAMGNMFLSNTSFNQDISKWNMSSVTSMDAMFYSAAAFTNGSNTNTNPITGLTGINGWNINTTATSVTMTSMFAQNTIFNQPIGSWNVSKVTNMSGMFYNTGAFNQPLVSWNVSKVTNMSNMFYGCPFNQNIGSWNVSNVTGFTNFMSSKTPSTYSSTNLDAIYNGWIVNGVQPNTSGTTNINFGSAKYTSAGAAGRLTLTSAPNNWIIQDGGL